MSLRWVSAQAALFIVACAAGTPRVAAQDGSFGVTMPITVSGDLWATHRRQKFAPTKGMWDGGFRAVFYPSAKLGSHWFAYSAIQVNSYPLFYYQTYYPSRNIDTSLIQALVGYTRTGEGKAFSIKAGKLASAFGAFPLRYDDSVNPLLDVPLTYYGAYVALRADRLPCGVPDVIRQVNYRFVQWGCGGSAVQRPAIWPVTMYGLPGIEFDVSAGRIDARFQLTSSSPANSQTLVSENQHAQWTAGAGVTIRQGFRVGLSAYRGPFLEESVASFLPAGKSTADYPATGVGVDARWGMGRFSANGEWTWYQFQYPGFVTSPAASSGYVELKATISPRFFAAVRASNLKHNRPEDATTRATHAWHPTLEMYEFGVGFHINHFQTLKTGYVWQRREGWPGTAENVFGVKFVTSIDALSKVIR